jgi:hypothetical protein
MRNITRASIALVAAVALTGVTVTSASAATGETPTTAAVAAGFVTITVPGTLELTSTGPGVDATGTVGAVTVTDATASVVGWETSISVDDFTTDAAGATTIPAADFTYTATDADTTGSAVVPVVTNAGEVNGGDDVVVQTATTTGNNTATWTAAVTLAVPATAIAGTYSSMLTHTVLP